MHLLTLNIWGAPYAKHRVPRIYAIADHVRHLQPDILAFQEVYLPSDRRLLIELLASDWPHYQYFESGVLGSGLLTMSRYPIIESAFWRFRLGGKPKDIRHGDYYVGKGVGYTHLDTPDGEMLVYNAHTHAQYSHENDNEYAVFTNTNLYEIAKFVQKTSHDLPFVLCGDLNTRPTQLGYQIIQSLTPLSDAYFEKHHEYPITYSVSNPYVGDDGENQCIDYIFTKGMVVNSIDVVMTQSDPKGKKAISGFSDHYGVMASLQLTDVSAASVSALDKQQVVLNSLLDDVKVAQAEVEGERINRGMVAFLGLLSLLDIRSLNAFASRFLGQTKLFGRVLNAMILLFVGYQVVMAAYIYPHRLKSLKALRVSLEDEIELLGTLAD